MVAAAACGSDTGDGSEDGGADAGAPPDATRDRPLDVSYPRLDANCSLPWEDPVPAANLRVVVDGETALGQDLYVFRMFVDADGVVIFDAALNRFDPSGAFVKTVRATEGDGGANISDVAQGPDGYGAVVDHVGGFPNEQRFCVIKGDVIPDFSACAAVAYGVGQVQWDGTYYAAFAPNRTPPTLVLFSADGVKLLETAFTNGALPMGSLHLLPSHVVLCGISDRSDHCDTGIVSVMPRTLDLAEAVTTDLLPADYTVYGRPRCATAAGESSLLAVATGYCYRAGGESDPGQCPYWSGVTPPVATLVTLLGTDGAPRAVQARVPPVANVMRIIWDGARYVVAHSRSYYAGEGRTFSEVGLLAVAEDGTAVWSSDALSFSANGTNGINSLDLAATGADSYVLAVSGTSGGAKLLRVHVEP